MCGTDCNFEHVNEYNFNNLGEDILHSELFGFFQVVGETPQY